MNTRKDVKGLVEHFASAQGIHPLNCRLTYGKKLNTVASCTKLYEARRNGIYYPPNSQFEFHFSEKFMDVLSREEMVDIVIHEVAHALTDSKKFGAHGSVWRRNAQKMGGSGNTLHVSSDRQNDALKKYRGTCAKGHKYYRNRLNHQTTYFCPDCGFDNGKITWETLR